MRASFSLAVAVAAFTLASSTPANAQGLDAERPPSSQTEHPPRPAPFETWLPPVRMSPYGSTFEQPEPAESAAPTAPMRSTNARLARVGFNLFTSTLFGTAGSLVGALGGFFVALAGSGCSGSGSNCSAGAVLGATLGIVGTVPLAVMLGGRYMDGDGRWAGTLLGDLAGTALGVTVLFASSSSAWLNPGSYQSPDAPVWFTAIALPVLGTIIGYELSSSGIRAREPEEMDDVRAREPDVSVLPFVAPIANGSGAVLGLGGTF